MNLQPSPNLFSPAPPDEFLAEMHDFILQNKGYPCVAAIKTMQQKDYLCGYYGRFGMADSWKSLRHDLQLYIERQKATGSDYFTFWALFEKEDYISEDDFEAGLWKELSHLTSEEEKSRDWLKDSTDPQDPKFTLNIAGESFFVVGLHPHSSRIARRFSRPALIFNLRRQFDSLRAANRFDHLKEVIRKREISLQGDVNPMVLKHDDKWESIQFSGKVNSDNWQCPFKFIKRKYKELSEGISASEEKKSNA